MSNQTTTVASPDHIVRALWPGVLSATSFGLSDILTKLALLAGADALTLASARGVLGTLLVLAWLRMIPPRRAHTARERWVALGIGLLFAVNLYLLYVAIRLVPVPVAILSYFVYPLITGISAAALGLEQLGIAGAGAALAALVGLALLLGAEAADLVWVGIGCALGAALCRVGTLLLTRALLSGADSRLTTWYSMLSSTAALLVVAGAVQAPAFPHGAAGWTGFLGVCAFSTVSMLALFASTVRVGAFRTALIMNLEPVVSTLLSMVVLGEVLTAVQFLGGAIMLGALCTFQLRAASASPG